MLSNTEGHTKPESLHSSFPMLCYPTPPCSPAPAETALCDVTQHGNSPWEAPPHRSVSPLLENKAVSTWTSSNTKFLWKALGAEESGAEKICACGAQDWLKLPLGC